MDFSIAAILAQDGITNGAVYVLLALALVLVFSVTRVIFIAQGEFVAFGALSLAAIQAGHVPATLNLLLALGALCLLRETLLLVRTVWRAGGRDWRRACRQWLRWCGSLLLLPAIAALALRHTDLQQWPLALQALLTLGIVTPLAPLLYRLAFEPLASAGTLVLLIVSVGVHMALTGLGLLMFGPEGSRTTPFSEARFDFAGLQIGGQSLVVVLTALLLMLLFYGYFERTLAGKALRATAVNRLGAQLVGIGTRAAGLRAFTMAGALGTVCGILISPLTTVYYDSGFLIGLKGFVGAIVGGLVSYPLAAAGALLVGLLEAYASFWASAYKEVIVFALIIPVLWWRSLHSTVLDQEDEA